ncbi:MAG: double-strand break repair protein AddB, partial [Pseudomonadota bacterium]
MEQRQTHVWTIDASQPFAACLVHGILERFGRAPLALAETVVLLPNQRAVRTVQTAFLQAFEAQASLLPRLAVLGEDLDEGLISESPVFAGGGALDATIEPMARLKILAQLIDRWQAD